MLKMKFENIGNGNAVEQIDKGEFVLQCQEYCTDVDLEGQPWASIFHPGQTVYMYMIRYDSLRPCLCPDCKTLCTTFNFKRRSPNLQWLVFKLDMFQN